MLAGMLQREKHAVNGQQCRMVVPVGASCLAGNEYWAVNGVEVGGILLLPLVEQCHSWEKAVHLAAILLDVLDNVCVETRVHATRLSSFS